MSWEEGKEGEEIGGVRETGYKDKEGEEGGGGREWEGGDRGGRRKVKVRERSKESARE